MKIKGYRFDDFQPGAGKIVHAFRTLNALKDFSKSQGQNTILRFWEIEGVLMKDEGGPDGLVLKVISAKQIRI